MATQSVVHHALLRPCILQVLRAAGFHATKPSVLDTLTDLAARYMVLLARSTALHAEINLTEFGISVQDIRMALQDVGALIPEKTIEDQDFDGEEDTRGVDNFLAWATGAGNKKIRRIALEGSVDANNDYLNVLKAKHGTADEDARYVGTIIGKPSEPRMVKVEGADMTSLGEWAAKLTILSKNKSVMSSRRESSDLSSVPDTAMMLETP